MQPHELISGTNAPQGLKDKPVQTKSSHSWQEQLMDGQSFASVHGILTPGHWSSLCNQYLKEGHSLTEPMVVKLLKTVLEKAGFKPEVKVCLHKSFCSSLDMPRH